MKPSGILYAAADCIREHGWTRGRYQHEGRVCMVGAIAAVGGVLSEGLVALPARARELLEIVCDDCAPTQFNDEHCKTANDAIAALEIAADIAAASGE